MKQEKNKNLKYGFTLLELLVVVLIIGILAAIALPQYKLAVAKSRVSTIYALGKSLVNAERIYYMTNSKYTKDIQNLDIDLPGNCYQLTDLEEEELRWFSCGPYFNINVDIRPSYTAIRFPYCPGYNTEVLLCEEKRDLQINFYYDGNNKPVAECVVTNSSELGQKVCSNIGTYKSTNKYIIH